MPSSADLASARLAAAEAAAQAGEGVFSLVDAQGWEGGGSEGGKGSEGGETGPSEGDEGSEAGPSEGDEVDRLVEALAAAARAPPREEGPGTKGAPEDHGDQNGGFNAAAGRLVSKAASAPPARTRMHAAAAAASLQDPRTRNGRAHVNMCI